MRTIKIISLLIALLPCYIQAQDELNTSDQTRTIEINNDNGDLSIKFVNSIVTEFTVNNKPISKDRYADYQDIIDAFSEDVESPATPVSPTPPLTSISPISPVAPVNIDDHAERLYTMITDYLTDEGLINTETKFKVQLKRNQLKVNGQKLTNQIHKECLNIFNDIYGHSLNAKSMVSFRKSRNNYKSSIRIVD